MAQLKSKLPLQHPLHDELLRLFSTPPSVECSGFHVRKSIGASQIVRVGCPGDAWHLQLTPGVRPHKHGRRAYDELRSQFPDLLGVIEKAARRSARHIDLTFQNQIPTPSENPPSSHHTISSQESVIRYLCGQTA